MSKPHSEFHCHDYASLPGLTYTSLMLLSTVIFLVVAIQLNGWKLDIKFGILLLIVYLIFNVLAILYELNIFGDVRPPQCDSIF